MTEDEKDYFYKSLGDNIRIAREKAGLKQGAFAELIGLSRTSVVNIEKGRQHLPFHLAGVIARVLKITYNDFIPASKPDAKQSSTINKHLEAESAESITKGPGVNEASIDYVKSFINDNSS